EHLSDSPITRLRRIARINYSLKINYLASPLKDWCYNTQVYLWDTYIEIPSLPQSSPTPSHQAVLPFTPLLGVSIRPNHSLTHPTHLVWSMWLYRGWDWVLSIATIACNDGEFSDS
ncbi:MAG TPA: hypothetical protein P5330_04665, partial [Candidatus Competibacteraceae bacterium]|nr:hypothetical protein [Candidatus Competibacteraceae bacterium]